MTMPVSGSLCKGTKADRATRSQSFLSASVLEENWWSFHKKLCLNYAQEGRIVVAKRKSLCHLDDEAHEENGKEVKSTEEIALMVIQLVDLMRSHPYQFLPRAAAGQKRNFSSRSAQYQRLRLCSCFGVFFREA